MLKARAIECRDDGVLFQYPTGETFLRPYGTSDDRVTDYAPKNSIPPPAKKGTIAHDALHLLAEHGPMTTMEIADALDRHRTATLNALKNLESVGHVGSKRDSINRHWWITQDGREHLANKHVARVRAHSSRVIIGIIARAHNAISTLDVIERAEKKGVPEKTVKWSLSKLNSQSKLIKARKIPIQCGPQKRSVCHWSLTSAGREAWEYIRKAEKRAA